MQKPILRSASRLYANCKRRSSSCEKMMVDQDKARLQNKYATFKYLLKHYVHRNYRLSSFKSIMISFAPKTSD